MTETLQAISPEIILVAVASTAYLVGTFVNLSARCWCCTATVTIIVAGLSLFFCAFHVDSIESDMIVMDSIARFGCALTLLTGLALILMSARSCGDDIASEYFASLLLVVAGGMFVAVANDVVLLFLGLELISIPTYVLLYLPRHGTASQESAAKYFFLSIFASALFLYGLSFLYGAVGSTNLDAVKDFANHGWNRNLLGSTIPVALVLIMAGLSFKVAAVPFHFYAPDVYQGTTTTLAALLAWAPKAAGIIAMLRIVMFAMSYTETEMSYVGTQSAWIIWLIAAATMTVGNCMGLLQDNLRRLFAYSSIAHSGYMLLGIGAGCVGGQPYITNSGSDSVVFYLLIYAVMTLGAFAVLVYLSSPGRPIEKLEDLSGLSSSHPGVALAMAVFLFSLTGIPITAGFWGKLALFSSALACNEPIYTYLAIIGVINAAISSYYYLRIIGVMYMRDTTTPAEAEGGHAALAVIATCAALTLAIGIFPGPFLKWTNTDPNHTDMAREQVKKHHPKRMIENRKTAVAKDTPRDEVTLRVTRQLQFVRANPTHSNRHLHRHHQYFSHPSVFLQSMRRWSVTVLRH